MVTERQLKSPKRYLYQICNELGMVDQNGNAELPLFTDPCAGGYKLELSVRSFEHFNNDSGKSVFDMSEEERTEWREKYNEFMQEAGKRLLEKIILICDNLDIKCWKPRVNLKNTFRGDYWVAVICVPRYEA